MISIQVKVQSATGLHARPASQFVAAASQFQSQIKVAKNDISINGKSIIGILGLGAMTGDEIVVSAEGNDEAEAITAIQKLFDEGL